MENHHIVYINKKIEELENHEKKDILLTALYLEKLFMEIKKNLYPFSPLKYKKETLFDFLEDIIYLNEENEIMQLEDILERLSIPAKEIHVLILNKILREISSFLYMIKEKEKKYILIIDEDEKVDKKEWFPVREILEKIKIRGEK